MSTEKTVEISEARRPGRMTIYTVCVRDAAGRKSMAQDFHGRKSLADANRHAAWMRRLLDLEAAAAAARQHYERSLEAAGLGFLVATSWDVQGSPCSCDCVAMLRRVCEAGETTLADAIASLTAGRAPAGAVALADAEQLLALRRRAAEAGRVAALAALREAYADAGLDADAEVVGLDSMTAAQLRDQLTYLADFQG
jgi:hypothetical protein